MIRFEAGNDLSCVQEERIEYMEAVGKQRQDLLWSRGSGGPRNPQGLKAR